MPATAAPSLIQVMSYDADSLEEATPERLADARALVGRRRVTWINVNAADDREVLATLEKDFGVHPLTIEDVRNVRQRPKVEPYGEYVYVVTRMLTRQRDEGVETEQMSILVGRDWLVTVQETPGDIFAPVRERLRLHRPLIRGSGPDYLMYALLDAIVDACFPILEEVGAELEALEALALSGGGAGGDSEVRARVQGLRRDLLEIRRFAWPQRDALGVLERGEIPLVTVPTRTFLRDVSDHASRVIDFVETNREVAATITDLHVATVAQRTSEVTKVLTVVATIFIPLTFIVGVYGMNFDYMPELRVWWAYPALLALMTAIAVGMLVAFRRQGWV